ncbi:hypothetical protein ACOYA6_04705 [Leclercia barmai]
MQYDIAHIASSISCPLYVGFFLSFILPFDVLDFAITLINTIPEQP